MADQLGSAVLTLSVDDKQLQAGFQAAQTKAASAGRTIEQAFTRTGRPLQTAANGIQFFSDAQGRLRDSTGKYLTLAARQAAGLTAVGASGSAAASGVGALGVGLGALAAPLAVAASVGLAVAGIGFAATQTAGQIQKLNAAFAGLTGSAEAAKQLRQDLFTLSKTTPFKNEEILQAAQRFLAVGVNANNLQGTINRVGAVAAQSGQSLERLALIYAQVFAKGRLQGEENLQLLEAGVDLTQELSQVTGLSGRALQDAMSKGQIGIKEFNAALKLATGDMTALQLAGQAVDVQFNNIFDNLGQLFGGFASSIAPALSAAFGVINQIFNQAFPSLASIEEVFAPLTQEAKRFSDVLAGNPQLIATIAAAVREWATIIVNNVAGGLQFVNDILERTDAERLVQSFITAELVIRRIFLAASALGAQLAKNAELTIRAASNPGQFAKDVITAGGFGQFIQKEYKEVEKKWNDWANSKPLKAPKVQDSGPGSLSGSLDDKQTNAEDASRLAAINQQNAEFEIGRQAIERQIESTKRLSAAGSDVVRQFASQREQVLETIASLRDQQRLLGAQIDAARLQGKSDQDIKALVNQQVIAASKIRLALLQGSDALRQSVQDAGRKLQDSVNSLKSLRLNNLEFLTPEQRNQAIGQLNREVDAAARRRGINITFRGTPDQITAAKQRFVEFDRQEQQLQKQIDGYREAIKEGNRALVEINERLADSSTQLAEAVPALAESMSVLAQKDWSVQVNVAADGSSSYYGDVQNGALTP